MVRDGGDHTVFERVAGLEAEDADGFDADVLVGGGVDDDGVGIVSDGSGENLGGPAAGVGDLYERNFDLLKRSVVVEIETGKLARAQFVVNFHAGVDFFSAGPVGFETNAGLEQFDLGWIFRCLNGGAFLLLFIGRLLLWFLRGVLPLSDVLLRY